MTLPRIATIRRWSCPNCAYEDVTNDPRPHSRFHTCAKNGLTAPMVPAGTRAKVTVNEREDYIGNDLVQTDVNGRPVMSITTTRDDGQDVAVFAATAVLKAKEF